MIPESFVQELLARVDITDVVGRYVNLRKGGANLLGLCPFHNEKSPSFTVSPAKQFYHCFGCGAHGTAITFLIEHTGASFPEAVRTLASSVGLSVPQEIRSPRQTQADRRRREEVSRHQQLLDAAQAHYVRLLKGSEHAINYLKQRGLTGQTAALFGLGWSGTDRRGLAQVFSDYEDPLLVECGLVIASEDGRRYDRFRERIMFPIRNSRGKLIGFGGRIVGKGEPKYLNSPETPLFSKGHELYGLWEGRTGIRKEGFVLVVEGYMDVVGLAQHGLFNAVATLGTATTPHHVQKLIRASSRIVFSFDGDAAGRRAAWKALVTCLPLVRDDVSMRFLFLPAAHDPDSYVRELGIEAFRATVDEAMPLSRFLLEELASRHPMGEAEGRAACVHEAAPLLAQLPESALRVQIEREFARMVLLTPEELSGLLARAVPSPVSAVDAELARQPQADGLVPVSAIQGKGYSSRVTLASSPDARVASVADAERRGSAAAGSRASEQSHDADGYDPEFDSLVQGAYAHHGDTDPDAGFDEDAFAGSAPVPDLYAMPADSGYFSPVDDPQGAYAARPHDAPYAGVSRTRFARQGSDEARSFGSGGQHNARGAWGGKGQGKARTAATMVAPRGAARSVTPMAKRVLRLLFAHPGLVTGLGDQELEILEHGPHMVLVKDLITLINASGAGHAGALLQAAESGSELHEVLQPLARELMGQDDLPDPEAEWSDALRRIELEAIKAEQSDLIASGLTDEASKVRYQELSRRMALIAGIGMR